ncbi:MAG: hemolysin [Bacteroidetes bacterium]|nr:MAG: hemolysin [Bacteroidota bacterium]
MDPDPYVSLLIILASLITSAFFSGMEMAFVSANRLQVELDSKHGWRGKLVAKFFTRPQLFIAVMLVGNNLALVICGMESGAFISRELFSVSDWLSAESPIWALSVQTLITTLVVIVTAEFIPKSVFHRDPTLWLKILSIPLFIILIILAIPAWGVIGLSNIFLFPFTKGRLEAGESGFGSTDLDHFLESASGKMVPEQNLEHELFMLQNALKLNQVQARDCLVPRNEVVAVSNKTSIEEIRKVFSTTKLSKIVVYEDDIDNIIGYIHVKDLFSLPTSLTEVILPTFFIPEPMAGDIVLKQFLRRRRHLAVVLDEFGGTSGILTMEDIVEELLGEIEDEHDVEILTEEQLSENTWLLSARHDVQYLNEKLNLKLPEEDAYETLGGLILHTIASIPQVGDEIEISGCYITIKEVEASRINLVEVRLLRVD